MGRSASMSKRQKLYVVFLNITFLVLASCVLLSLRLNRRESSSLLLKAQTQDANFLRTAEKRQQSCAVLRGLDDNEAKCSYLKSKQNPCVNQGYIDYLYIFYCKLGSFPSLGYSILTLWLLVLFYLLGNTASEYFCSSLESLAKLFDLSPTIAGVTLLSLGNGAPDVFSSLVSFIGGGGSAGTGEVGLNTVLGGASVVTCVVVGVISIAVRKRRVRVNKPDFVRDVFFFLLVLLCLGVILVQKELDVWGAMTFFSIYLVYVVVVYVLHTRLKSSVDVDDSSLDSSDNDDLTVPILPCFEKGRIPPEESTTTAAATKTVSCLKVSAWVLEMPLYLPRRLTIPVISENNWSKFYGVASATLAPVLLSLLGGRQVEDKNLTLRLILYAIGSVSGLVFGATAMATTARSSPPKRFALSWLGAGFLMSVTWSYIAAQELVGLLVSLAYILKVNPSILGLTVLAWGNSLGDLVTNLTMALNGGPQGAQIAFAGCYAGPIFNTLFGLGLSLVGFCWSNYPSPVTVPSDPYLLETLGFLAGGLFWALLVLPRRGMRLDGVFGGGLLVIYFLSLSLSLCHSLGSAQTSS